MHIWGMWEISVLPSQFCCKSKTALKNVLKKQARVEEIKLLWLVIKTRIKFIKYLTSNMAWKKVKIH